MIYLFYTVHVVTCIFLILVVLLQQGKGADLSVFGGGATQTAFGARGAATMLHKMTVGAFIGFIVTTISIGVLEGGRNRATVMGEAIEEQIEEKTTPQAITEEEESSPAAQAAQEQILPGEVDLDEETAEPDTVPEPAPPPS